MTVVVELDGRTVAFAADSIAVWTDVIGGREYEIATTGVGGTVTESATGEPVPARTAMWLAVVSAYPDVELRG